MSKDNKVAEKDEGTSSSSLLKLSEEVIPRFNGTDKGLTVSNWASEVEDNATIYGWTPLQKLLIARRSLEGTAALWLRTEKAFKSYEDLKTALEKEFPDTATAKDIHELLSDRKKKKSETCYEYMLAMKEIGKRGKLADYVTIQYIIEGIIDNEQNKMMLYGANSYVKLKEQLKLYEQLKCNMAKSEKKVQHSPMTPKQQVQPVKNCYNCGAKSHIANACPDKMKGLKCFKCNNFGHKATECTDSGELRDVNKRSAHTRSQVERARDLSLIEDTTASQCQTFCAVKTISLGDSEIPCLVDTGSELNLITSDFVIKSGIVSWENCSICVSGLGQNTVKTLGKLFMSVKIDDKPFHTVFHIMPSGTIPHDVIIGQELMSKATILINNGQITFLNDLTTDDDSWEDESEDGGVPDNTAHGGVARAPHAGAAPAPDHARLPALDGARGRAALPRPLLGVLLAGRTGHRQMSRKTAASLIMQHTVASRAHLTPELRLRLITPACPLWTARGDQLPFPDPYWGFYWPGGQATARYILDNPEIVKNRRVLDIGCGCGAGAIAAAKMKAKSVLANDIDTFALEATAINASLNAVSVATDGCDLVGAAVAADTLLVGDMFYDEEFAEALFSWLTTLRGTTILIGDPGRHGLTQRRRRLLSPLATYRLPPDSCLENRGFADTTLWQLKHD